MGHKNFCMTAFCVGGAQRPALRDIERGAELDYAWLC